MPQPYSQVPWYYYYYLSQTHHSILLAIICYLSRFSSSLISSQFIPKGTSIEATIKGKRQLRLLASGENYEMDSPNLTIKLLPPTGADWLGNVRIKCKESGLQADLCYYKSHVFLGFGGSCRSVKGTICHSKTLKTIYEIDGQWDRYVGHSDSIQRVSFL